MIPQRQHNRTDVEVVDFVRGQVYRLNTSRRLGGGGEASVYVVEGDPSQVAKVYIHPNAERARKLDIMIANPPKNPTEKRGHLSYAWPTAAISGTRDSAVLGFLMPRVESMKDVFCFYNPASRRETCPYFNYQYLHTAARNIAWIMEEVHLRGYVIGDVNQKNILVSDDALVTLIDTDSFQIKDDASGQTYLCTVDTDDFRAPERKGTDPKTTVRNREEDFWGLGVLIFHLLMEGVHPFNARYVGSDPSPNMQQNRIWDNVVAGRFPYAIKDPRFTTVRHSLDFGILHPDLRALFIQCFVDGHSAPSKRPPPAVWKTALRTAMKDLIQCPLNKEHYFGKHLGATCPWCARVAKRLKDPFPKRDVIDASTRSNVTPPVTRSNVTPPVTRSNVTPPVGRSNVTPPVTKSNVTPPVRSGIDPPVRGQALTRIVKFIGIVALVFTAAKYLRWLVIHLIEWFR